MYDIIVVGAGTAGLSAAIYGMRAGKSVLVLESGNIGGQIVYSPEVDNYPGIKSISGFEFIRGLQEQAIEAGAEIRTLPVESIADRGEVKEVMTPEKTFQGRTLILATGVVCRKLGLEGEERMMGQGVSYCAVCDGAFYRGKDVAVVGGGNTALEDAIYLSGYCRKVYLIHRRDRFRGQSGMVDFLHRKDNVEFVLESIVSSLLGNERLDTVIVKNTVTNIISELKVSAIFVAIGQRPQNEKFADVVTIDPDGYILSDESCRTSTPGIFAAGDCRVKKVRQLVTAAADGAIAALEAYEHIIS